MQNRITFRAADDPSVNEALEETRPGLGSMKVLSRKMLSGTLLDGTYKDVISKMKTVLKGNFCVLSQDGWSNIHNHPIVATTIHYNGETYPLDFIDTGSETKTAE